MKAKRTAASRKRRTPTQKAKDDATRLHSLIVRSRGACESCGETEYRKLQCAHIVSRRYSNTRTIEANAFCLCAGDHMHFTLWPLEFQGFVESKIGMEAYNSLRLLALATTKVDWETEARRLSLVWDRIQLETDLADAWARR